MTPSIDIGDEICKFLDDQKRSVAWLAGCLNHDPSNLRKLLKHPYLPTDLLFKISEITDNDFFEPFSKLLAKSKESG
ncbi:MAG: hypothetical protein FWH18_10540 [Marinilabiliaceae bacterium]|nr:hypothetical protein [Marinilabiliaceae bacterium]